MAFHNPGHQVEYFFEFLITHPLDQLRDQAVVRELLQVVNQGVFIGFPICPETHQTAVVFNKIMGMYFFHIASQNVSYGLEKG